MNIRELRFVDVKAINGIYELYWANDDFRKNLSEKLETAFDSAMDASKKIIYFIAEEQDEVVGIVGYRKCSAYMLPFTKTKNPAELYILAAKYLNKGIGKTLIDEVLAQATSSGYTEVVLYSGESHNMSWGFYDHLGFKRVGPALAPNGEPGVIWRLDLVR